MTSEPEKKVDTSLRTGVLMSLASVVIVLLVGFLYVANLPENWHVVTRHSDTPEQVLEGIAGLESEAQDRVKELTLVYVRALRKANECRMGVGEPGETVDDAKKAELLALAPKWEAVAERAKQAVDRFTVTVTAPAP